MSRNRLTGRRRIAVVAGSALVLSGAAGGFFAIPAFAKTPAEIAAESAPKVAGTPCTANASACVDVRAKKAWLIKNGKIARGPVPIATGGKGEDTPTGNVFRVYRKEKDYKSQEFKIKTGPKKGQPAPMPYSVFFEDGGIAFHSGSPSAASAGCVHLNPADAVAFFNFLQIGQHVQVMDGPVAAPAPSATASKGSDDDNSKSDDDDSDHHHHHDDGDDDDDDDN
jgi:hypothetical protein